MTRATFLAIKLNSHIIQSNGERSGLNRRQRRREMGRDERERKRGEEER